MASSIDFSKKSLVLVTGASRGIGRTIAIEVSRHLPHNSIVILIARSPEGLEETKLAIHEIDKSINVFPAVLDLSQPNQKAYETIVDSILSEVDTSGLKFGVIFHNSGSTGDLVNALDLTDVEKWKNYFEFNLFSTVILNSVFVRKIRTVAPQLASINITSLAGRQPFGNLAMYGSGKAARDIYFKVLAVEEPKLIILNYSPGPVDTDMFDGIIEGAQSEDLRNQFKQMKEGGTVLTAEKTVSKLLEILEKGDFQTGATIDYYDRI